MHDDQATRDKPALHLARHQSVVAPPSAACAALVGRNALSPRYVAEMCIRHSQRRARQRMKKSCVSRASGTLLVYRSLAARTRDIQIHLRTGSASSVVVPSILLTG